jgi:predicted DNA-binding antitoxin AbrB/MazE fold protein
MSDNKATIEVVYRDGVFVPQADVSHLADGTSIDIHVPAPDEWDLLLEAIAAEDDDATLALTRGRWDDLGSDTERWVIDSDEWLVWNLAEAREPAGILI